MSWGGQSSVTRFGIPGPKNAKSSATKTTTWHCSAVAQKCLIATLKEQFGGFKPNLDSRNPFPQRALAGMATLRDWNRLRFLQRNGCEPACGHRGHCNFAMRFFAPLSAVPKRDRSKLSRTQKHANACKRAQMSAKERKRKSTKGRKRAQKGAKERKSALLCKNCKQPGLKQPGLGTPSEGRKWGVGSVVVRFGVFGVPRFSVQRSPDNPYPLN